MKNLILLLTITLSTLQSFAQWSEFVWDTISFEEPYEYIVIDISNQNIWQIGEPNKTFFDSAYSKNNAIVTDTTNCYPVNNYSYFDLKLGNFNFPDYFGFDVCVEIKHKFNTDTLKDGGFITVSYDNGITWLNIIKDTTIMYQITPTYPYEGSENLYSENDTLYNGELGFSGNSNGWITTLFSWYMLPCKDNMDFEGDTMIVRFNFISDSIGNNKEGWMIDNIKLYSFDLGGGLNNLKPLNFRISPNPMTETTFIDLANYKELELSIIDIQGKTIRKKMYMNNQLIRINKYDLNPGIYFIKIITDDNLINVKKLIIK